MPGKRQRTEGVDFLGNPYRTFKCSKCSQRYQAMTLDTGTICPPCANPDPLEEYKDPNGCNCYSCMSGRAMKKSLENLENDKGKHSETH